MRRCAILAGSAIATRGAVVGGGSTVHTQNTPAKTTSPCPTNPSAVTTHTVYSPECLRRRGGSLRG